MGLTLFKRRQRLQEGTQAVPEELPTPPLPPEAYQSPAVRSLIDQVRQGILPDEALDEIKRDPTSLRSMGAYGEAALGIGTLLSGGEGGKLPKGEVPLPGAGKPHVKMKLTGEDASEALHRMNVMRDTPELYEEYGLSPEQMNHLVKSIPRNGGDWEIPHWGADAVHGELTDHVQVLRDMAADARSSGERGQALSINKQATRLERLLENLPVGGSDVIGNVPGATTQGDGGGTVAQEPPQQHRRGTSVVKGYGPTHMLNTL